VGYLDCSGIVWVHSASHSDANYTAQEREGNSVPTTHKPESSNNYCWPDSIKTHHTIS